MFFRDINADKVIGKIKEMGEELKEAEVIITGKTKEIAEQRGFLKG